MLPRPSVAVLGILILLTFCHASELQASQPQESRPPGNHSELYPLIFDSAPGMTSPMTRDDGRELLVAMTEDDRFTILDVTVEDGGEYVYARGGKGQQLRVDGEDFPTLARTGLHSEIELQQTKTITGRSVAEITEIGHPGQASGAGFMAADEDIISVLRGDNRLVRALGLTHQEMARPLFHVWNAILAQLAAIHDNGRPWGEICCLRYNDADLFLEWHTTKGWQESIFDDEIHGGMQINISRSLTASEVDFLRRSYPTLDDDSMTELTGALTRIHMGEMGPYYVRRYGFYEGHTEYRAEPLAVALIFGLRSLEEIEEAFPNRLPVVLNQHHARSEPRHAEPISGDDS